MKVFCGGGDETDDKILADNVEVEENLKKVSLVATSIEHNAICGSSGAAGNVETREAVEIMEARLGSTSESVDATEKISITPKSPCSIQGAASIEKRNVLLLSTYF